LQSSFESDIYADEGISGTNTKKRLEFNRMIDDCTAGKIDLILIKSISRFARNTLDCLQYVRQLKDKNIGIKFEKENIYTLDGRGDMLITIMSSLAQEESSGLSKSTRMGIVYRFQEGKVKVNHNWFLGYTKDENGELIIDAKQGWIVERIYREFLEGKSTYKIADGLMVDEIINGSGNKKWWDSSIDNILRDEKYMGDVLLQKTYTVDFLTKKRVKNDGYVQKYYIEDNHEPIISKEMFAAVQAEFTRRSNLRGYSITGKSKFTSTSPFSGKLFCNACGSKFVRHSWGTGKHPVWKCINHQMNGDEACNQKAVKEWALEKAFVRAMTSVIGAKDSFIEKLLNNIYKGLDLQPHNFDIEQLNERLSQLQHELMGLVKLNAKTGYETTTYDKEYEALATKIEDLRVNRQGLIDEDAAKVLREQRIEELKEYITTQETALTKFDEDLFRRLIEKVSVKSLVEVTFVFKTGVEVKELLE